MKILDGHKRVALTGVVNSGKSLLLDYADLAGRKVVHTDDLRETPFEEKPARIQEELEGEDEFIVAGMQVPRALRKGLEVDCVVWLNLPRKRLTTRQAGFSKGARTILDKWRRENQDIPVFWSGKAVRD
jgi:hypothetical protein